jgi:hypothetical protein
MITDSKKPLDISQVDEKTFSLIKRLNDYYHDMVVDFGPWGENYHYSYSVAEKGLVDDSNLGKFSAKRINDFDDPIYCRLKNIVKRIKFLNGDAFENSNNYTYAGKNNAFTMFCFSKLEKFFFDLKFSDIEREEILIDLGTFLRQWDFLHKHLEIKPPLDMDFLPDFKEDDAEKGITNRITTYPCFDCDIDFKQDVLACFRNAYVREKIIDPEYVLSEKNMAEALGTKKLENQNFLQRVEQLKNVLVSDFEQNQDQTSSLRK